MNNDLNALGAEVARSVEAQGLVLFHGVSRVDELPPPIYWDTARHPDFNEFLTAAKAAGAHLITYYAREFREDDVQGALAQLEEAELPRDEAREVDRGLRETRRFVGSVCQVELSFDLLPRVYTFDLRAPWYDTYNDILDTLEDALSDQGSDDGDSFTPGYFSKN